MSDIDKGSLSWIGYSVLCDHFDVSAQQRQVSWGFSAKPSVADGWRLAAEAIASEAIKRYKASINQVDAPPAKPSYGNFLEITRIMSGG